jgi:hypothetical protein
MGKFSCCIALVCQFLMARHPGGDRTDDRLSTGVDMNVLDCDALLTLAAASIERLGQSGEGPREFTRLVQALAPPSRAKIEAEDHAISAAVASFDKEIAAARAETKKIQERMADRTLTDEQVAKITEKVASFQGQEFGVIPYWDIPESTAIANRIYAALNAAN